jgi:hypothetical protein
MKIFFKILSIVLIAISAYAKTFNIVSSDNIIGVILFCAIVLLIVSFAGLIATVRHKQVLLFFVSFWKKIDGIFFVLFFDKKRFLLSLTEIYLHQVYVNIDIPFLDTICNFSCMRWYKLLSQTISFVGRRLEDIGQCIEGKYGKQV